jgi:aminoglycoside/choline kinase family phosphotransferase
MDFCGNQLKKQMNLHPESFRKSVFYCALTRNLQILGAFGYLSRVKGKKWFEQHLPRAIQSLRYYLHKTDPKEFPVLKSIAQTLETERGKI